MCLTNFDSHLNMQFGKFGLKANVRPNNLEKDASFNLVNKLVFIDYFQCLSFLIDIWFKKVRENDFKCTN